VSALVDPFLDNAFLARGLIAGLLVAVACAAVGTYVILRGLAFVGEALGHGVLPGVAAAILLGAPQLLGAAVAAAIMIVGVTVIVRHTRFSANTALGLLFVAMLSLGVVIVSRSDSFTGDLTRILFGDILGISWQDIYVQLGFTVAVVAVVLVCSRPFLLLCFDPEQAKVMGFDPRFYENVLLAAIATTVVGSAIGIVSVIAGLLLSYHFDLAAGAMIVVVACGTFFAGLIATSVARRRPAAAGCVPVS